MVQLVALVMRLACQVDAELFENARVDLGEDHGRMNLQTLEMLELIDGCLGIGIMNARDSEGDQQLIEMQKGGVVTSEVVDLHLHDRAYEIGADQLDAVRHTGKSLEGVEKER